MSDKIAIIVEWENALLSEVDRAKEMFRRLQTQTAEAARKHNAQFELMLIYDSDAIERDVPANVVAECIDADKWSGTIRLIAAPGLSYYEQKNFGARQTDADIVVFIDSDVVPDASWLGHILEAMRDPGVNVVSGETYLATDTYMDRIFAAFWLFDVKKPARGVYEAKNFYANNVAFRGDVIRKFAFPQADTYRGQCTMLAKELRSADIRLYRAGSAMVSHPAPTGWSHFVSRAVCHGHDIVLSNRRKRFGWIKASPLGSVARFVRDVAQTPGRIVRRRKASVNNVSGMLTALGFGVAYATFKLGGEIVTFISPGLVRRRFNI